MFESRPPHYQNHKNIGIDRRAPVSFAGEAPSGCQPVVVEDEDDPIYYGMVYPTLVQLRCDVG